MEIQPQPSDRIDQIARSVRNTVIITGACSAMATILGVSLCNAYLFSNVVATLESREDALELQREIKRQAQETDTLLKKMQERLDKQAAHD